MHWRDDAPTLQQTKVHAKCLRPLPTVREYFRTYRIKKRPVSDWTEVQVAARRPYMHSDDGMAIMTCVGQGLIN